MSGSNKLEHSEPNLHQTSSLNACKSCPLTILSTSKRAKDAKTLYVFSYFFTSSSRVIASPHFSAFKVSLSSEPSENHASSKRHSIASRRSAKISEKTCLLGRIASQKQRRNNILFQYTFHLIIYKEFHIAKSGSKRSFPYLKFRNDRHFFSFLLPSLIPSINRKTFGKQKTRVDFKNQ